MSNQESQELDPAVEQAIKQAAMTAHDWVEENPERAKFYRPADSEVAAQNRQAISREFDSRGLEITATNLTLVHELLLSRGVLKAVANSQEQPQPRDERGRFASPSSESEQTNSVERSEYLAYFLGNSTRDIRIRANRDREFRAWLESRVREETSIPDESSMNPTVKQPKTIILSAEEVKGMPASVLGRKLQDPIFYAAYDALVKAGQL